MNRMTRLLITVAALTLDKHGDREAWKVARRVCP